MNIRLLTWTEPWSNTCRYFGSASGCMHIKGSCFVSDATRKLWTCINLSHSSSDKRSSKMKILTEKKLGNECMKCVDKLKCLGQRHRDIRPWIHIFSVLCCNSFNHWLYSSNHLYNWNPRIQVDEPSVCSTSLQANYVGSTKNQHR